MTAERMHCTEAQLRAGYHRLGLLAGSPPDVPESFETCDLVDGVGDLTATARTILPLLARPPRIITVCAVTAGDEHVDLATIVGPIGGGPFVVRGDRDGTIDLVVLDSPTEVLALLDRIMSVTGAEAGAASDAIDLAGPGWLGLLAAVDAVRATKMRHVLARSREHEATFDLAGLTEAVDQALRTADSRWTLGAVALVDRAVLGDHSADELATSLVSESLAVPADRRYRLTRSGAAWASAIGAAARISHVRVLDLRDGRPFDVLRLTCLRSPTSVLTAETAYARTVLGRSDPEIVMTVLRAVLASGGHPDVASGSAPAAIPAS